MKKLFIFTFAVLLFFSCQDKEEDLTNYPTIGYDDVSGNPFIGQWMNITDTVHEDGYRYLYILEFDRDFIPEYNYSNKGNLRIDKHRITTDGSMPQSKRFTISKYIYNQNTVLIYNNEQMNNKGKWKDIKENPLLGKEPAYRFEYPKKDSVVLHMNNKVFNKLTKDVPK